MPRKTLEEYANQTAKLINPITRSEIILDPPFGYDSDDELRKFMDLISQYCDLSWRIGVIDVREIKTVTWINDWYGTRSLEEITRD